jgi:hypothetical protein
VASAALVRGDTGVYPRWLTDLQEAGFVGIETFSFDVQVPYSHEGVSRAYTRERSHRGHAGGGGVEACSRELATTLTARFPEDPLTIPHRVWAVTAQVPAS